MEVLIVGLGGVGSKRFEGGPIRQLTVGLGKVVILVQDDNHVALIVGRMRMLGLVRRERSADFSDLVSLGCYGRVVGNLESEMLLHTGQHINMEGGQSGTYLRLTRASSGPRVSIAETYRDETKQK